MLTADEKKFLEYWEKNNQRDKNVFRQFRYGLPIGLSLAALIVLNYTSGWYQRATMVANSQSTPIILIAAIIIIIVFWSVVAHKHKWEMNDQRYRELIARQKKEGQSPPVQQYEVKNGQSNTNL